MFDCILVADDERFRPFLQARLRSVAIETELAIKVRLGCEVDISCRTPDLAFLDFGSQNAKLRRVEIDFLEAFTAIVLISKRPLRSDEKEDLGFNVDGIVSPNCSQAVFNSSILRAMKRRNHAFAEDSMVAHQQLIVDMHRF